MHEITLAHRLEPRHFRASVLLWKGRRIAATVAFGLVTIAYGLLGGEGDIVASRWLLLAGIYLVTLYPVLTVVFPARNARKNPLFDVDMEARLSEDGVHLASGDLRSSIPWRVFSEAFLSEDLCLLIHGGQNFVTIIPPRLDEPERRARFLAILETHLPKVTQRRAFPFPRR